MVQGIAAKLNSKTLSVTSATASRLRSMQSRVRWTDQSASKIRMQQIGLLDHQQIMSQQLVVLTYRYHIDFFEQNADDILAIHVHYHTPLEAIDSIQRREAADITGLRRIPAD